jgi:hypothetical protein
MTGADGFSRAQRGGDSSTRVCGRSSSQAPLLRALVPRGNTRVRYTWSARSCQNASPPAFNGHLCSHYRCSTTDLWCGWPQGFCPAIGRAARPSWSPAVQLRSKSPTTRVQGSSWASLFRPSERGREGGCRHQIKMVRRVPLRAPRGATGCRARWWPRRRTGCPSQRCRSRPSPSRPTI